MHVCFRGHRRRRVCSGRRAPLQAFTTSTAKTILQSRPCWRNRSRNASVSISSLKLELGRLEQHVVHVAAVQHMHTELVVHQDVRGRNQTAHPLVVCVTAPRRRQLAVYRGRNELRLRIDLIIGVAGEVVAADGEDDLVAAAVDVNVGVGGGVVRLQMPPESICV